MVACALELEFVYAEPFVLPEKDDLYPVKYRLPKTLRTAVAGKRIALVDDVINAGSAIRGTFVDLQACGARPVVLGALLVLGHSGPNFSAEQGLALECLARLPNNLWPPSKCPLCAANVPLDKIAETPLAP
jgi:orotate phosphoribosyltransferase